MNSSLRGRCYGCLVLVLCLVASRDQVMAQKRAVGSPASGHPVSRVGVGGLRVDQGSGPGAEQEVKLLPGISRRADQAIQKGLRFLTTLSPQLTGDGALSSTYPVAVTALGGMALMGAGVEYNRGPFGPNLVRAIDYLVSRQDASGYIRDGGNRPSKMHGHAYAVLFLAQVVGSIPLETKNLEIRKVVARGVRRIEDAQTADGGWGYDGRANEPDEASITVCCLQAMRAAKDAGFQVSAAKVEKAVWYLQTCAKPDGSFRYSLKGSSKSSYELTAAAVSTLDAAGEYSSDIHRKGVSYMKLMRGRHSRNPLRAAETYTYYGNLYAAQVYFRLGGEDWQDWADAALPPLISMQTESGGWKSSQFGAAYATAIALLILEIPLGYLPVFER